jgi:hypothetical protein
LALITFAAFGCTINSTDEQSFGAPNHHVVTSSDSNFNKPKFRTGITAMATALLTLAAAFAAGFFAGYWMRALRSQKRRAHYQMYAPYQMSSAGAPKSNAKSSTFGHPRRAF